MDISLWLAHFADDDTSAPGFASSIVDMLMHSVHVYKNPNCEGFRIIIAYNLAGENEEVLSSLDLQGLVTHRRLELRTP